jgi:short-subunit dehydrogenase
MDATPRSRTALVTGASTGIGAEYARALAERGFHLVLVARRAPLIEGLAAELADRHGVAAATLAADLADPADRARVEERLRADGTGPDTPVDLLVNNAGRGDGGPFAGQDPANIDAVLDLNVRAVLHLTRAVLPVQAARRAAGHAGPLGVLNVSSVAGDLAAAPGGSVYSAGKAFLTQWSQSVAVEAAGSGVRVTAVLPGYVRTDLTRGLQESGAPGFAFVPKEVVVRESLRAWAAGRALVVPGLRYRAADALVRLAPRGLFRAVAGRVV